MKHYLNQPTLLAVLLVSVLLVLLLLPQPSQSQSVAGTAKGKPGWQLTFDEEFSGSTLNTQRWTCSEGTFPTREEPLQYFLPSAVTVDHGHLRITSQSQFSHGFPFTSGEIHTQDKFCQLYGRLETRCRFPKTAGAWSAVYLLPADGSWPPEIDVAEFIGRTPEQVWLTNHWKDFAGEHQQANRNWIDPTVDWGAWHTYAVEWEPDLVRWYIDGLLRGEAQGPASTVPMYIRINTAVGGSFAHEPSSGPWPQIFDVDYVRMYRWRDGPQPVLGPVARVIPPPAEREPLIYPAVPSYFEPPATPDHNGQSSGSGFLGSGFFLLATPLVVWWWMRGRVSPYKARTAALAAGVGAGAANYVLFRWQIIPWVTWWIGLPLFLAELHGILHTLGLQYTLWPRPDPIVLAEENPTLRPIFILIPTVNEGSEVLELTIGGALATRTHYQALFPNGEVTIVVCNDGYVAHSPDWYAAETLAERMGVICVTRPVGGGAKAGNIEFARQAVGAVGDALIVLFDADQVAEKAFLVRTIPPFQDTSIGWVQTGQYYRNRENAVARWANDQQALFYRVLCPGKAALNAAFICGTNVVLRAEALDEIGGLPQDSVTEDFAASLQLHPRWRSVFLPEVLAWGLGPMDMKSYFTQQGRWATGTLQVLRRHWRTLILPSRDGLSFSQRVQYGLACTHYLSGLRDLVYLAVPFLFLLMGISAIQGADMPAFLERFLPYWALSQIAFWHAAWRKTTFRGIVLSFGSFPVLLASLLIVALGQRTQFAVTPKRRASTSARMPLLCQTLALAGCLAGLIMAVTSLESKALVLLSALWLLYMLLLLAGILWLGFWDQRAGHRSVTKQAKENPPSPE